MLMQMQMQMQMLIVLLCPCSRSHPHPHPCPHSQAHNMCVYIVLWNMRVQMCGNNFLGISMNIFLGRGIYKGTICFCII